MVPLFNEVNNLPALHTRLLEVARRLKAAHGLSIEVLYVDDGSSDATLPTRALWSPMAWTSRSSPYRAISERRLPSSPASIMPAGAACCSWTATVSIPRR